MNESIETLNMRSTTLERVVRQIKEQRENEDYTPICIIGKSGIGKTESIAGVAAELGIGFKELRLSHYQESDLVGLPYIENGITKHAETDLLPPSNDPGQGILLLDEVTSSQKSMRSAVYQLMDSSRKLGHYKMPEKWLIVACGNGPDDGGDFRGIEAAFLSRGSAWRVEPNLEVWKKWALKKEVHPTVIAFLTFRPEMLHYMPSIADHPYDMIACPRNWSKLSTNLFNMEKRVGGVIKNDDDLEFISAGCVGANVGPSFAAFYRYNKQTINAQDIVDGKVPPRDMLNVTDEVLYITAQNLVHLMTQEIKSSYCATTSYFVTEACFKKVCNLMKWLVELQKVGVRLDVIVSITQDISTSLGNAFAAIVLDDAFDAGCPDFAKFCLDTGVMLNGMC